MNDIQNTTRINTAIAAGLGILLVLCLPSVIPSDATRIRNSLIADSGPPEDFKWRPQDVPPEFIVESRRSPFFESISDEIVSNIDNKSSDWDKALAIARHLTHGPGPGDGISSDSYECYRIIMSERRGHCSDYTQVFNGLALAADIAVREWGVSFDGFGGHGHAINEVYDPELGKWIMIDPLNSLYVVDPGTKVPLSVLQFRKRLLSGQAQKRIAVVPIVKDRFLFDSSADVLRYYKRGADQFFLWLGNDIFSYENHPVVRLAAPVSRAFEQGAAILAGVHPRIKIVESKTNAGLIAGLYRVRNSLFGIAVITPLFLALLYVEVELYRFSARRRAEMLPSVLPHRAVGEARFVSGSFR